MTESGKIYKVVINNQYFYIGSTKNSLISRLAWHLNTKKGTLANYLSDNGNDIETIRIEIIATVPIFTLKKQENDEIMKHKKIGNGKCLNKNMAFTGMTRQQYNRYYYNKRKVNDTVVTFS